MYEKLMRDTVTLYHKTGETENGAIYTAYVLDGVRFERRTSVLTVESGLQPYNSFRLFVDLSRDYGGLTYAEPSVAGSGNWTVSEQDFITSGVTRYSFPPATEDSVRQEREVYTVTTVTECGAHQINLLELSGRGRILY